MVASSWIPGGGDLSQVMAVREAVFVHEQGFSAELERDGKDLVAHHLLLAEDGAPVAAARVYAEAPGVMRIGRICVLKDHRGKGYGDLVMRLLIDRCLRLDAQEIRLGAQQRVRGFYEKYGFIRIGEPYDEEGVPHLPMGAPSAVLEALLFGACGGGCQGCAGCAKGDGREDEYGREGSAPLPPPQGE